MATFSVISTSIMENLIRTDQLQTDLSGAEIKNVGGNVYQILNSGDEYFIEVIELDLGAKSMKIRHKHSTYDLVFRDHLDDVLDNMGIKRGESVGDSLIKAPMPGKIIDVLVEVGQTVEKGDGLFVLEAMKMENVLKSEHGGEVQSIFVEKQQNVEKNESLLEFSGD